MEENGDSRLCTMHYKQHTLNNGLGSFSASDGMSIVPHLYASSALFRFQASRKSVAHTMLKMLKNKMHQSRVTSPLLDRKKVMIPRTAGAISHLVYIPSQAKYMAIFTPKYWQMSSVKEKELLHHRDRKLNVDIYIYMRTPAKRYQLNSLARSEF